VLSDGIRNMACGCVADVRTSPLGERYVHGFSKTCGYARRLLDNLQAARVGTQDAEAITVCLTSHGLND
jgi:hypothetical protein